MPITLPVEARADDRSFSQVANNAEKRFGQAGKDAGKAFAKGLDDAASKADPKAAERWSRAYDKVADSAGKVRVEEAKLADLRSRGASETRLIAQSEALERARRAETRATRDATSAYQDLGARSSGVLSSITDLAAGTRFGGLIADTQALTSRFGGMGLAVGGAITAVAGLAVGIGTAAVKLYDLGAMWDDVADSITARTGKIGDDLNAVMDQVSKVALDSSASIGNIGDIAGRVSSSIGATGDQLGDLTAYIADLNDMTGEQTNIKQLGMLYRVFGVATEDQVGVLNELYTAFTKTQIPVNEMIGMLVSAGPKFKQFDMSLSETVSMLGAFTDAGVNPEAAITGLNKALKGFSDAGRDPKQALTEVIAKIKELHDTGNDPAAARLAADVFGAKNFTPFLEAIESGKVGVDQIGKSFQGVTLDIRDTRAETDDFAQEWTRFKNFLSVELQPVATAVFGAMNDQLRWFADSMRSTIDGLKAAWNWLQDLVVPDELLPGVGPGVSGGGGGSWGDNQPNAAGSPGKGFPLPWTLPPLTSRPAAYESGMVPNNVAMMSVIEKAFPGIKLSADTGRNDKYGEHGAGEALDIMVGTNKALGDQVNQFLLQNADALGLQYTIWQQKTLYPDGRAVGMEDRGSPTQNHMDHVHARVSRGPAAAGAQLFGPTPARLSSGRTSMWSAPMAPSGGGDFGPGYQPGPTGGTPGYDDRGNPGYYVPDPRTIRGAQERVQDVQDSIAQADTRIEDTKKSIADANERILQAHQDQLAAIHKSAELDNDYTATEEQKANAQRQVANAGKAVTDAIEQRDRIVNRDLPEAIAARDRLINRSLRDANESLAEAQQGQFRSADRVPGFGRSGSAGGAGTGRGIGQIGAPIAGDFGFSGGLPGIAENLTNFLANLGFAPALGALSGIGMAMDPYGRGQGGGGLLGMGAALGGFGMPSTVNGIAPSPIGVGGSGFGGGGGLPGMSNIFGGPLGAPPGPAGMGAPAAATPSTLGGTSPGPGAGGSGFGGAGSTGIGGMAMQGVQAGISAAGMALDTMMPGAGTAASMAANIGVQLGNRAIGQAGKAVGITVGGLLETFLPANSKLADPGANWFGRIAGGFAGAKPALPNMTGQPADKPTSQQPDPLADPAAAQQSSKQSGGPGGGVTVNYNNYQATEDRAGADLTTHLMAMNSTPGL